MTSVAVERGRYHVLGGLREAFALHDAHEQSHDIQPVHHYSLFPDNLSGLCGIIRAMKRGTVTPRPDRVTRKRKMDMTQNRKVAIVTGSSRGIGAMTARRLAAAGQCVYAGVRDIAGKGAAAVKDAASFALEYS